MTQFFDQLNTATDREIANGTQRSFEMDQAREVEELGATLVRPARELASILVHGGPVHDMDRDMDPVPPDVTVINPHRTLIREKGRLPSGIEVPSPRGKLKVLGRLAAERGNIHARYHNEDDPEVVGRGWVVSRSLIRGLEHTVTLLESGELVLGRAEQPKTAKERRDKVKNPAKVIEVLTDDQRCDVSKINLTTYPVNPLFKEERGYATTNGVMPQAVKDKKLVHGTEAARVAVNLEQIARDLRASGRKLLDESRRLADERRKAA